MYARPFINSLEFATNRSRISGEVLLAELPRLLDMLKNPQGILSYTVQGGVDRQGTHFLDIGVVGQFQLICQRCLNGLDYPLRLDSRLLLRDQAALDALDDNVASGGEEELDSILADARLNVLDMLEEEILLSLPIAPKHELGVCQVTEGKHAQMSGRYPFAVLDSLKRN